MLVFIQYPSKTSENITAAFKLENIKEVTPVRASEKGFQFFVVIGSEDGGVDKGLASTEYSTREEAEMAQVTVVSIINALSLFYTRYGHTPEHYGTTPVPFQVVNPETKELEWGKVTFQNAGTLTVKI